MPILTITSSDLKSAGLNILVGAAHKIVGGAVAYLVIQAARRVFSLYEDKTIQRLGRATILASGLVSYCLTSQTPLKAFSFRKAVELYLLEVILNVCCKRWISSRIEAFVPGISGTLGGNLGGAWLGYLSSHIGGRTSLIFMGIMGAQSSFCIDREDRNRPISWYLNPETFIDRFLA